MAGVFAGSRGPACAPLPRARSRTSAGHGRPGCGPAVDPRDPCERRPRDLSAAGVDSADGSATRSAPGSSSSCASGRPTEVARAALLDPAIHSFRTSASTSPRTRRWTSPSRRWTRRSTGVSRPVLPLRGRRCRRRCESTSSSLRTPGCATATAGRRSSPPTASLHGAASAAVLPTPALLVHASQFGLVREEQLEQYERELGDGLEVVAVPGGHIVYWDAFEETAAALERFLL